MRLIRHLAAILALPFVMVVLVPRWLAASVPGDRWSEALVIPLGVAGAALFLAGFALFAWCVGLFGRVGEGTLAPWDPTRRLVAVGPYRYTRNPMITGVATMLCGEALALGSRTLAIWAAGFVAVNHLYFLLVEEPGLERRFGASYREYRAAVPRWLPRRTPWTG